MPCKEDSITSRARLENCVAHKAADMSIILQRDQTSYLIEWNWRNIWLKGHDHLKAMRIFIKITWPVEMQRNVKCFAYLWYGTQQVWSLDILLFKTCPKWQDVVCVHLYTNERLHI